MTTSMGVPNHGVSCSCPTDEFRPYGMDARPHTPPDGTWTVLISPRVGSSSPTQKWPGDLDWPIQ